MSMLLHPAVIQAAFGGLALASAAAAYTVVVEPLMRLVVKEHRVTLAGWGARPPLVICVIADPHCCEPWMPVGKLRRIVAVANGLAPDLHVITGDLPTTHRLVRREVPMDQVADTLADLHAPLGRFAILGNHDWSDDVEFRETRTGRPSIERHLRAAGIPVLCNEARLIPHGKGGVWLCGTDSMQAYGRHEGADDLPGTLAQITTDAPAILLAHEPDQFPNVPDRVGLTLSGHTHAGQVQLSGYAPVMPSDFGNRYRYGHIREGNRQLIVSAGLGCSLLPIRFGAPPEITIVRIG